MTIIKTNIYFNRTKVKILIYIFSLIYILYELCWYKIKRYKLLFYLK